MKLYPHQVEALRKLHSLEGKAGLFIAIGGGKTRTALADMKLHNIDKLLVVLPISVTFVWSRECSLIDYHLPVYDGTVGSIRERAKMVQDMAKSNSPGVLLVNYEAYWREPLRTMIDRWGPNGIILDEGHRIRHRGSRQARFAHTLSQKPYVRRRLLLTGTPITNGLQDAWSLYRFINPQLFGSRWADFERRHLILGGFQMRQVTGYQNEPEAKAKIANNSYQWDGGFENPPDVPILVPLSAKTRRVYDELKKKALVEVQNAAGQDRMVVARIALVLLLRLQQITSGFTTDVGEELIDLSSEKADVTLDLVSDIVAQGKRAVVFTRFLHDIDLLEQKLSEYRVGIIRGGQNSAQRGELVRAFDAGEFDVMLVQIRAGGLGIDLASASAAIFYSVGFSLDDFLQAKGRLAGALRQRHSVVYYHLLATNTVDQGVYGALTTKTKIAERMTDLRYALNLLGGTP